MYSNTKKMRIPSFAILRSFECAARHQSFTLAAEELHVSQSAISRQVKELEHSTGIALFRRVGRQVALTQAGKKLAEDLSHDLARIRQTLSRAIIAGNQKTVLRIASLPTFANKYLIPRIPKYMDDNPNIEIDIATRLEPFSLTDQRFDVAIHYGIADWPGAKMTKLCDEAMYAVASPDFKKKYNINDLASLINVPLIHLDSRANAWNDWFKSKGVDDDRAYKGKKFDQFSMIISATIASIGTALIPDYLIEKELSNGSLVQLSDTPFLTKNCYYVVTPHGTASPQTTAFVNWIQGEISRPKTDRQQS